MLEKPIASPIRIGINGFGRIGKMVFRLASNTQGLEVVHVNDKMDTGLMSHLLKYDSVHGKCDGKIDYDDSHIIVNGIKILVTNYNNPSEIPWDKSNADIVVDSCGKFLEKPLLEGHLDNGAKKVILSCPANDDSMDRTVVMGVNNTLIKKRDRVISNASCTTNCVAIMLQVLKEEFGIKRAFMNTVHPTTNNQNLQDGFHSDYRRARSAINNIIPTTSSAIKTTKIIFPELENCFDGFATRVPVSDSSFVELTAQLDKKVTVESINEAFLRHSETDLKAYLEYCEDPIVSSDVNNNRHSVIFDSLATKVLGEDFIQILGWYDNECGYSARIIDLIRQIGYDL